MTTLLHDPLVELFEGLLARQPMLWAGVWFMPLLALFGLLHAARLLGPVMGRQRVLLGAAATIVVAAYLLVSWQYMGSPRYLDHVEPTVASISWAFAAGKPVYHSIDSAQAYSNLYGPSLYVLNGLLLKVLGPSVPVSKLAGVLAASLGLLLTFLAARRQTSWLDAGIGVAVMAAVFLVFRTNSFFTRSEPLMIACAALSLYAATGPATLVRAALLGAAVGVAVNLKVHAPLYVLPGFVMALSLFSRRDVVFALVVALVVAVAPFGFANISLGNYLTLLRLGVEHGFNFGIYLQSVEWLVTLAVPALLLLAWACAENAPAVVQSMKRNRYVVMATIVAVGLVLIPASKNGAGPHHMLPFVPVFLVVGLRLVRDGVTLAWRPSPWRVLVDAAVYSWLLSVFIVGGWNGRDLRWQTAGEQNRQAAAVLSDIDRIYAAYGDRYQILMGTGGDQSYPRTWYRPQLVFRTGSIGVDPSSLMDFQQARRAPPDLHRLTESLVGNQPGRKRLLWLIPAGDVPFTMQTYYVTSLLDPYWMPRRGIFTPTFRREFGEGFSRVDDSSPYYDLYAETAKPAS